tara:strand:- start:378 stop:1265 length:888 start_codon:yes stop_codon:yes gene_type:complete
MADGTTTNYGWVQPEVGASADTWGGKINTNWGNVDTLLGGVTNTEFEILDGATLSTTEINILDGATLSTVELNYVDGVTSAIQTQLNAKQAVVSGVSNTEIGYLNGVTSAIQTQINTKQAVVSGVSNTEIGYLNGVTSAIQTQFSGKLGTSAKAADSELLDGVNGSSYLRSDTSDTFTGTLTVAGTVSAVSLQEDYDAASGTTPTLDADNAGYFSLTTSGNTTFTFGGVTSGRSVGFILSVTAGGTHTLTWPSTVDWAGGAAPDAPASGASNLYVFVTRDGGSNWVGVLSSAAYA